MAYYMEGYEKWKVYVKSKDLASDDMNKKYGMEIGLTDTYSFQDYTEEENTISNTEIILIDNKMNTEFYNSINKLKGSNVEVFFIGARSNKILRISGDLHKYIEIQGSSRKIRYSIKHGTERKEIRMNLTINFQVNL